MKSQSPAASLLVRIVSRLLPVKHRRHILGDILEEYRKEVRPRASRLRAESWFWRRFAETIVTDAAFRLRHRLSARHPDKSAPCRSSVRQHMSDWSVWQDFRYAVRVLLERPVFTGVSVLTLGLCLGIGTAIYSVVDGILLEPLPYADPERLALVRADVEGLESVAVLSGPELLDLREQGDLFEAFGGVWASPASVGEGRDQEPIQYAWVTANLFGILGVDPLLGRHFLEEEDQPNGATPVILSFDLWQRRYGRDPSIIGRRIQIADSRRTVVGVMPEGFRLFRGGSDSPLQTDLDAWIPQTYWVDRDLRWIRIIARLKPGVSFEQAGANLDSITSSLQERHASEYDVAGGIRLHLVPLHRDMVDPVRPAMLSLLVAVGFLILIACANISGLLLGRYKGRERELALRTALGAGRRRIVQQVLTENLLLASTGGLLGLLLAHWGVDLILALEPPHLPRLENVALDSTVLAVALTTMIVCGTLFTLAPGVQALRLDVNRTLKEGGPATGSGLIGKWAREFLVVSEVALCLALLIGAGLMVRTFAGVLEIDLGFNPDRVLTFDVATANEAYPDIESRWTFFRDLTDRLDRLPGIERTGGIFNLPLGGGLLAAPYAVDTHDERNWGQQTAQYRPIIPGYFESMRTPLLSGRFFEPSDGQTDRLIVVVDQTLAGQAWGEDNPIGKKIKIELDIANSNPQWAEVVGVVPHARLEDVRRVGLPQIYVPFWDVSRPRLTMTVRTTPEPMSMVPSIRSVLVAMGPGRPVRTFRTMGSFVDESTADTRFASMLMSVFAVMAAILASVGLYGVMAYIVKQRGSEIGIRIALGAHRKDILGLIVGKGMTLTLVGVALGLVLSLGLTRLLSSMLYGVQPIDLLTFLTLSVIMIAVAFLATYVPARRASRTDVLDALRHE